MIRNPSFRPVLAGSLLWLLAGCSGGNAASSTLSIDCGDGSSFCLVSCDLGCTSSGCSVSDIAENQRLRFVFSQPIDRRSVNNGSLSIRTATGASPDGTVTAFPPDSEQETNIVVFEPRVSSVGGISTFGFARNETYIVTLAAKGSGGIGITSLAGDGLAKELRCTVTASRGVLDEDQQPPVAELVSPADPQAAPRDPTIVLRFSELIDTSGLQQSLSGATPIRVLLRSTRPDGSCNTDESGLPLSGLPQLRTVQFGGRDVSELTFRPSAQLPGQSCVSVEITADLRDLSGRQATPQVFNLLTVQGTVSVVTYAESFSNNTNQDPTLSGGQWGRPGTVGNDGRHGSFNAALGVNVGSNTFEWNVDSFSIPATASLDGVTSYLVTDGRFFFTDFIVPDGQTIRFRGSRPPQIFVSGAVDIRGTVSVNAPDMPFAVPTSGAASGQRVSTFNARSIGQTVYDGQPGGLGGPGGGDGGRGGHKRTDGAQFPLIVNGVPIYNGQPGEVVQLLAGHAYLGSTAGTGGPGAPLAPAAGTNVAAGTPLIAGQYRTHVSRGGGGGGFTTAGSLPPPPTPNILPTTSTQPQNGPVVPGGVPFALFPYPPLVPPPNYTSLNHFLVGGSGGGGGGSHPFGLTTQPVNGQVEFYMAGHGGSGGGGALAIRAGGRITIHETGRIQARGGMGVVINGDNPATGVADSTFGISSPGGGGSGGSILLQSGNSIAVLGSSQLDTSGGPGSRNAFVTVAAILVGLNCQAGAGSPGFFRLESPGTISLSPSAVTVPAPTANTTGPLTDTDGFSTDGSKWRSTGFIFPPQWLRYELDVDSDGDGVADTFYTDAAGGTKANSAVGPVRIFFQGAQLPQNSTTPVAGTIGKWREGVGVDSGPGIAQDSVNGFRFLLIYNQELFPNVRVTALRVFAQS